MDKTQRRILAVLAWAFVATTLVPPWGIYHPMGGLIRWRGFSFLLSPPDSDSVVLVSMLFAEWVSIGIIGALVLAIKRGPKVPAMVEREIGLASKTVADAMLESARIQGDATIRAAEIHHDAGRHNEEAGK